MEAVNQHVREPEIKVEDHQEATGNGHENSEEASADEDSDDVSSLGFSLEFIDDRVEGSLEIVFAGSRKKEM